MGAGRKERTGVTRSSMEWMRRNPSAAESKISCRSGIRAQFLSPPLPHASALQSLRLSIKQPLHLVGIYLLAECSLAVLLESSVLLALQEPCSLLLACFGWEQQQWRRRLRARVSNLNRV
uniref:Uncharacterized protein n=1 Tax=Sphaerodactylus townsendi TaxID=933632 RepID=A0ACB8EXU6_9SAUR